MATISATTRTAGITTIEPATEMSSFDLNKLYLFTCSKKNCPYTIRAFPTPHWCPNCNTKKAFELVRER